jgi:hypothetical protein
VSPAAFVFQETPQSPVTECVMAATHAVEWLDLKGAAFCAECRRVAF